MHLVYTTFPDRDTQERVADTLVEERLAACVVSLPVTSLYWWDDEKTQDDEVAALFKTPDTVVAELVSRLEALHPYDVPCILTLEADANTAYAEWLEDVTT